MDDVVTPSFHALSASGEIVNSPMNSSVQELSAEFSVPDASGPSVDLVQDVVNFVGTWSASGSGARTHYQFTYVAGSGGAVPSGISPAASEAIIERASRYDSNHLAQSALNRAQSSVQRAEIEALIFVAELPGTLNTIKKLLLTAYGIFQQIRKGQWREIAPKVWRRVQRDKRQGKFRNLSNYIADVWLEARYAIRPIVYDILGALSVFRSDHRLTKRMTFRGFDEAAYDNAISYNWSEGGVSYEFSGTVHGVVAARAGILGEARFENGLSHELGIFNIATMVWDLTTYSFVVGWFINVSTLLYKLNPNPIYEDLASWTTISEEQSLEGDVIATLPDGTTRTHQFRWSGTFKDRTPDPVTHFINLDINLDIFKVFDMAALFRAVRLK